MVGELREVRAQQPDYPHILFAYLGETARGDHFFENHWPEASAIADESGQVFQGFSRERGSLKQLFGFPVWGRALRAFFQGYGLGKPSGDPRMMPGVFLIRDSIILHEAPMRHVGDHPDFAKLPSLATTR